MKLRNIIIYKRRHLAAVTYFTEKWATTKPGSSCLNLVRFINSDLNFALQSQLNAGKKLIAYEMTAEMRKKKTWVTQWTALMWHISKTPRLFYIVLTARAAERLLCQPGQHQTTSWPCLCFCQALYYGSVQLWKGHTSLHKCSHSSSKQRYALLVPVMYCRWVILRVSSKS